jgi:two-component system response regulator RegA
MTTTTIERSRTLLLVDDDETYRARLARSLSLRGRRVLEASGPPTALRLVEAKGAPDEAVLDVRMPDGSGIDLLRALLEAHPKTRVVVLTGYGYIAGAVEAVRIGAIDYLTKPADADEIVATLDGKRAAPDVVELPTLARVEHEHINRALATAGGNVSRAARMLRIERKSLQRKLARNPPSR